MNAMFRPFGKRAGDTDDRLIATKRYLGVCIRTALGLVAIAILVAQVFDLTREPRFHCAVGFILYAVFLLWYRRKSLDGVVVKRRTWVTRMILFPGYLLLLSTLALILSVWFLSLTIASVASVLYLGWLLGRWCSPQAWASLAPPWMILFLICTASSFQSNLPATVGPIILDSTSRSLDRWSLLHVADSSHFHLLNVQRAIPVEMDGWLSPFCFVGLVLSIVVTSRQAFLQGLLNLCAGIFVSCVLPAIRIIVVAMIPSACDLSALFGAEILPTVATFLIGLIVFFGFRCLISFCISTIAFPQNEKRSLGTLSTLWNRCVDFQASPLLAGAGKVPYLQATGNANPDRSSIDRWAKEFTATRHWWKLIAGLPNVMLVIYMLMCIIDGAQNRSRQPKRLLELYAQRFNDSLKTSEFSESKLLLRRLRQLDPFQQTYAYQLANAQVALGNVKEGEDVIGDLVAENPHDIEAHAWLAKRCLMRGYANLDRLDLTQANRTELLDAEKHLSVLLQLEPKNWEARAACVAVLALKSDIASAVHLLNQHKSDTEQDEIKLIRLMTQLQQHEEAAVRARALVTSINRQNPDSTDLETMLILAEAQQRSGKADDGMETLMSAFNRFGSDPKVRQSLVVCGIELCRSLNPLLETNQVVNCLKQIEGMDSESPELAIFVAKLALVYPDNSEQPLAKYCRDFLQRGIAGDRFPNDVLIILGTGAAQRKKMDVAYHYLQQGYDRGVRTSALLNNLAWVVMQQSSPDLQLALKFANEAIEIDRHSHDALLTRADIFMQLGKYTEAITDLKQVHKQAKNLTHVRRRLAECYRAIGEPEIEADFKKQLEESDLTPKPFQIPNRP